MSVKKKSDNKSLISIPKEQMPKHIAIIMDGNGRWAKSRKLPRIEGHRAGTKSVREIVTATLLVEMVISISNPVK